MSRGSFLIELTPGISNIFINIIRTIIRDCIFKSIYIYNYNKLFTSLISCSGEQVKILSIFFNLFILINLGFFMVFVL